MATVGSPFDGRACHELKNTSDRQVISWPAQCPFQSAWRAARDDDAATAVQVDADVGLGCGLQHLRSPLPWSRFRSGCCSPQRLSTLGTNFVGSLRPLCHGIRLLESGTDSIPSTESVHARAASRSFITSDAEQSRVDIMPQHLPRVFNAHGGCLQRPEARPCLGAGPRQATPRRPRDAVRVSSSTSRRRPRTAPWLQRSRDDT